ncbi:MAG: dihydropteroate synthase [Alloprevotella sp.]|nr:dihydropteroate synthase [Alloprevotella sp.]
MRPYTLNCGGKLIEVERPMVMGILNLTPDSFYPASRAEGEAAIRLRTRHLLDEGADIIDVGAYSSRPGAADITPEEEMRRLREGLQAVRREGGDSALLSVDTFRADVARMCVEEFGVQVINDISGGELDSRMFRTVASLHTPYVLMHMRGTPQTMQAMAQQTDGDIVREVFHYLSAQVLRLQDAGVADIILDPGFGFGKTLEQNYRLMAHLEAFSEFGLPLLVGISRKSMIYKLLGSTPEQSLNGTTALNAIALTKGADILRVHDVKAAVEAVTIFNQTQDSLCSASE